MNDDQLIPPHGGYAKLKSFQMAEIVYDATAAFCSRFVDRRSRTHDQMVQAARSGRQNIAEGSQASGTSKKTALKPAAAPAQTLNPESATQNPEPGTLNMDFPLAFPPAKFIMLI